MKTKTIKFSGDDAYVSTKMGFFKKFITKNNINIKEEKISEGISYLVIEYDEDVLCDMILFLEAIKDKINITMLF